MQIFFTITGLNQLMTYMVLDWPKGADLAEQPDAGTKGRNLLLQVAEQHLTDFSVAAVTGSSFNRYGLWLRQSISIILYTILPFKSQIQKWVKLKIKLTLNFCLSKKCLKNPS